MSAEIPRPNLFRLSTLATACLLATAVVAAEETTPPPDGMVEQDTHLTETVEAVTIGRSSNVEGRLSAEFAEFLGGEEAAASVVEGLRTGQGLSLAGTDPAEPVPPGEIVQPPPADGSAALPTGTMGYGNVRLTLKLAEASLAQMGVGQPTNEQLSAVLLGGEINGTPLQGILNERAAGAGWGELAQRYGFKVGDLMGKGRQAVEIVASDDSQPVVDDPEVSDTQQAQGAGKGAPATAQRSRPTGPSDVRHAGKASGDASAASQRLANGYIPSHGSSASAAAKGGFGHATKVKTSGGARSNGYLPSRTSAGQGAGIVSGAGVAAAATNPGQAKGHFKGASAGQVQTGGGAIVSAGNASAAAAVSSAGGQGLAKGHSKGKP